MKKSIIYIVSIFVFLMTVFTSCNFAYAEKFDINDDGWAPNSQTEAKDATKLQNVGNTIIGAIRTVGTIISVAVFAVLGIKYMTSDSEEKAAVKETLVTYLIACCVIFGAFTIWKIVVEILN